MAILGFGFAPFGSSIYGYGSPDQATVLSSHLLEGSPNGESHPARYIDPQTRDYVIDENGVTKGQNSVSQQVFLALMTDLGSASVTTLGSEFSKIRTIDESTPAKLRDIVNKALSKLVKANLVKIVDIKTSNLPAGVTVQVVWQNTGNSSIEVATL